MQQRVSTRILQNLIQRDLATIDLKKTQDRDLLAPPEPEGQV
jgi:hypothetical protein